MSSFRGPFWQQRMARGRQPNGLSLAQTGAGPLPGDKRPIGTAGATPSLKKGFMMAWLAPPLKSGAPTSASAKSTHWRWALAVSSS